MKHKNNLAALRLNKKLKVKEVAELVGVTRWAVNGWESGKHFPEAEHEAKLCHIFNVKEIYTKYIK